MEIECINLKEAYGDRYRVEYEASYHAEYGPSARNEDPWLMIITGKNGHIFPWGGDVLAATTSTPKRRGNNANLLVELHCCQTKQDGDDGVTVVFHRENFDDVAEVIKPRRRRRLNPAQREAAIRRLAKYRFRPAGEEENTDQ